VFTSVNCKLGLGLDEESRGLVHKPVYLRTRGSSQAVNWKWRHLAEIYEYAWAKCISALVASRVKKVGWAKTCNFPTDSCKCPTEQIKGARNFNFAPKLTNFSPKLRIFGGKNSDKLKFRGGGDCPPAPSHDATAQRSIKRICLWPLTECTELLRGANECRCCCCCCICSYDDDDDA